MFASVLNLLTKFLPALLPKLLTERPDLLVDHALAYAALAKSELESTKREWVRRIVAGAIASVSALAFIVLAGTALMLCVTAPPRPEMMWVMFAVPGTMLALALVATGFALTRREPTTLTFSGQLRLDLQAFRAAMESRS